jgi:UDP-glucose 4-epimerase
VKVLVTGTNGMIGAAVVAAAPDSTELRTQVGPVPGSADLPPVAVAGPTATCDITDHRALRPLVDGVDVVVHLAGPPSVAASFADPVEFHRAHVLGTATVVQLCRELAVPRLVYVSSAEVYGRPRRNPVDEHAPLRPRSPYAAAKVGAESAIGAAARADGLTAAVLRPFSVYGPGTRRDSVLGHIVDQALAGTTVRLRNPDVVRDFCYVGDLADAVWLASSAGFTGVQTVNVGSGRGVRVGDLARTALEARHGTGAGATVETEPHGEGERPPVADIAELVADVRAAHEVLGWRAATSLADGLARTLDWRAQELAAR